ncbi:MAG TPA: hypothetical protein VGM08_03125, partial [Candidatus Saccharimonadales bacterium]
VQFLLLGEPQSFSPAHNAELFAIAVDDPELWCPNCGVQASTVADIGSPYVGLQADILPEKRTEVKQPARERLP